MVGLKAMLQAEVLATDATSHWDKLHHSVDRYRKGISEHKTIIPVIPRQATSYPGLPSRFYLAAVKEKNLHGEGPVYLIIALLSMH